MLVNHDEQITVYEQIAGKFGLTEKYGKVVSKPTMFTNNHSEEDPIDVAFVDEQLRNMDDKAVGAGDRLLPKLMSGEIEV